AANEGQEVGRFQRLAQKGLARGGGIGENDEGFAARGGKVAQFGAIVGLEVFVGQIGRDGAAAGFIGGGEGFGQSHAIVVVDIGQGNVLDVFRQQQLGELFTLESVGRCGAEDQIVVFE